MKKIIKPFLKGVWIGIILIGVLIFIMRSCTT